MVKIRLAQTGAKNQRRQRLVAMESKNFRDGKVLEILGTPAKYNQTRVDYWRGKGAQPTKAVAKIINRDAKIA